MVSVIIPAYNASGYIARAIKSVLAQDHAEIEIVVVDDGSSDELEKAVRGYPAVRYLYQENRGPAAARNVGIRHASGDLVAFLDSDDEWLPGKLAAGIDLLEKCRADLVFTRAVAYNEATGSQTLFGNHLRSPVEVRECLLTECAIILPTVLVRKAVFEQTGLFDENLVYAEDWDLFYRIARSHDCRGIDEPLTKINLRAGSLTRDHARVDRLVGDTLTVIDRIYSYPENAGRSRSEAAVCSKFLRELADEELYHGNPGNARNHLRQAMVRTPLDTRLHLLYAKSLLWETRSYYLLRRLKGWSRHAA